MRLNKWIASLLALALIVSTVFTCATAISEENNRYEQSVPFGIIHSGEGSDVSVFVKPGSKNIKAILPDSTLCSVVSLETLGGINWFHISFFDEEMAEQEGYVAESDFCQFTLAGLLMVASDPEAIALLQTFIAADESRLYSNDILEINRSIPEAVSVTATPEPEKTITYVLNTNTKKFHYPWCDSVEEIKSKNRRDFYGTRDEIPKGYVPCKKCNP